MYRKLSTEKKNNEGAKSMVEIFYKRIVRVAEYYIFFCFILIAVILPFLLDYKWIDSYVKFIYFTAFPLLVILLVVSLFKEVVLDILKRRFENPPKNEEKAESRRK
jgi:fumarate reductase subunit C